MSTLTHRPAKGDLKRPFAAKPVPGVSTIKHLGWDIGWGGGYEIYAAAAGKVVEVRWSANTKTNNRQGGYGNYFIIDHGNGITTLYAHQPTTSMLVRLGEHVVGGQRVGTMGNTGNAAGAHLHFEVRLNGVPVDPAKLYATTSPAASNLTPIGEDDMSTKAENEIANIYQGLFYGASVPIDGKTQVFKYGVLPIVAHNQTLIAQLTGKVGALVVAVNQLSAGEPLNMTAIEDAAERGAKEALDGITVTLNVPAQ